MINKEIEVINASEFFYNKTVPAEVLLIKYGINPEAQFNRGNENVDKWINQLCETLSNIYKSR